MVGAGEVRPAGGDTRDGWHSGGRVRERNRIRRASNIRYCGRRREFLRQEASFSTNCRRRLTDRALRALRTPFAASSGRSAEFTQAHQCDMLAIWRRAAAPLHQLRGPRTFPKRPVFADMAATLTAP